MELTELEQLLLEMKEELHALKERVLTAQRFVVVCGFCFSHNNSSAVLEWNFRDKAVYYMCPDCGKRNDMTIKALTATPYPKARLTR